MPVPENMNFPESELHPDPARIEQLFHSAAELPLDQRAAFLTAACGGDAGLEQAVHGLLTAGREAATAWDRGAMVMEARHSAGGARLTRAGEFFGPYRILRRIAAGG